MEDANSLTDIEYERLDANATKAATVDGIDRVLKEHDVDVIIGPADSRLPDVLALASKLNPTEVHRYLTWYSLQNTPP
jgi:hypothetical protein